MDEEDILRDKMITLHRLFYNCWYKSFFASAITPEHKTQVQRLLEDIINADTLPSEININQGHEAGALTVTGEEMIGRFKVALIRRLIKCRDSANELTPEATQQLRSDEIKELRNEAADEGFWLSLIHRVNQEYPHVEADIGRLRQYQSPRNKS